VRFILSEKTVSMKNQRLMSILAGLALLNACASANNGGSADTSAGSGGAAAGGTGPSGTGPASGGVSASGAANGSGGGAASFGSAGAGGSVQTEGGAAGTSSAGGAVGSAGNGGGSAGGGGGSTGATHWVGTWTASPYPVPAGNLPPASLSNSVLRQVVHVSLGGNQLRVQFSNLSGNGPVTINSVHIAVCKAAPAVDSTIDPTTDKALSFSGSASVTIAAGKEIWSDPVDFTIAPLGNISITVAFGSVPSALTGHAGSRTTSYQQTASSAVSAASMPSAKTVDSWYYISGMDVMANASAKGIVAIGDSITDGRGSDTNKNNRWTDILSARLQGNAATANVSMMNQGIGGTNLVGTSGTAAEARFSRDVLGQSGVRYAIVFDGVNDIGGGASFASLKGAYDTLISAARAKGLLIYGATILPFGGNSYYSVAHESVRQQVNAYIKSGAFDGYIDFDAALTDGGNPPKLQTVYATWAQMDGLHPGPAGYQKMGDSVDLTLFTK
jgi:lysophospholipase L1-like esterase